MKILKILLFLIAIPAWATVEIQELPDVPIGKVGFQEIIHEKFWEQTGQDMLQVLIPEITTKANWPAVYAFKKKMLMARVDSVNELNGGQLLEMRLRALFNLGAFQEVVDLAQLIPINEKTDTIEQLNFQAQLLSGGLECAAVPVGVNRISCFLTKEEPVKAALLYDMLQDEKKLPPEYQEIGDIIFHNGKSKQEFQISPENASWVIQLPDFDVLKYKDSPWVLKATALFSPNSKQKILAAEALGDSNLLKQVYLSTAEREERSKLFADILKENNDNKTKATLLRHFIKKANNPLLTATVLQQQLKEVKPVEEVRFLVPTIIPFLALWQEQELLQKWLDILPVDSTEFVFSYPFSQLQEEQFSFAGTPWLKACAETVQDEQKCAVMYTVLGNAGTVLFSPDDFKLPQHKETVVPQSIYQRWKKAVSDWQVGDSVLLGIYLIEHSPNYYRPVLRGWKKLGLIEDFRSLLLERMFL